MIKIYINKPHKKGNTLQESSCSTVQELYLYKKNLRKKLAKFLDKESQKKITKRKHH